uniref:Uncharacterized protein n=1 Tax=Knipowitschia caucasica TaxID=637954 RepID=A0AAV2KTB7_KNICA
MRSGGVLASSLVGGGSTVHVTDVEAQGDNVQTETVSETEERPKLTNDSAGERHKEEDELEMTEEEPIDTKVEESQNSAMSPDHGNPSHETTQSSQDTDAAIPNEDHGDIVTDIDQETQACIESLKVDGDGDGSHRLDREAPNRQTDPVGPTSNHRSYLEYSLILEQLTEERAQAEERCKSLQMKLAPILAKKPREEVERLVQGEGDTARYEECLRRLTEIKMRMKEEREEAERRAVELREQAQRRLSKVSGESEHKAVQAWKQFVFVCVTGLKVSVEGV